MDRHTADDTRASLSSFRQGRQIRRGTVVRDGRTLVEALEDRLLMASAGRLLEYDFNAANAWPAAGAAGSTGVVATAAQSAVGTIDTEGGTVRTGGINFAAVAPTSGAWRSQFTSGRLANPNTGADAVTNLGMLTLGFNLSASQARSVTLRVISYNDAGQPTGELSTEIDPAAVNSYQRFSVDLSTMRPAGPGTFDPTAPAVSFDFEIGSVGGWSRTGTPTIRVDNVQYSKPGLYVSSIDGSDSDDGTTEATAVRSLQKAFDLAQPGDIILVKGDAANPYRILGERTLVRKGGTPAAWVSLKNYPGQSPLIYSEAWNAIQIGHYAASDLPAIGYVEIRGLHFQGGSLKVGPRSAPDGNYDPANAALYNQGNPANDYAKYLQPVDPLTGIAGPSLVGGGPSSKTNGNGLSVDGGNEQNKPHDIRFADNVVEQFPGGGIGAGDSDRIQIENNVVRDNCYWDKYGTSGISILSWYSFDGTTGSTTRLVRGNVSSGNIHKQKWVRNSPTLTQYSDGNGIIIDYNHNRENTITVDDRTLVTNNVVFDNGGSGIHSYQSDHVDIVNNTAYFNSSSPHLEYGEIFSQGTDTRIYNNILYARTNAAGEKSQPVNGGTRPSASNGIVYKNNLYFGGNANALQAGGSSYAAWPADEFNVNNKTEDPKFAVATINAAQADFRLQAGSVAAWSGLADALAPQKDILGNLRNGSQHIGAYEYYAVAPTIVVAAAAMPAPVTGKSTLLTAIAGDDNGPAALTYTWSTVARPAGSSGPTFGRNGTNTSKQITATFARAGAYTLRVTVSDGTNTSSSDVNVTVNQTLTGITVSPATSTVDLNGTKQFAATAYDQFGVAMATQPTFTWAKASGVGAISSAGLYTAPAAAGSASITATSGSVTSAAASVTVADLTAPTLSTVTSSKVHGSSGTFAINLALGGVTRTIEPRLNGANRLIFTFSEPIKALDGTLSGNEFAITNATFGSATISGNTLTLNLTGVVNRRYMSVSLAGLADIAGNALVGTSTLTVGNLLGDVNRSGNVSVIDQQFVKSNTSQAVTATNFLYDVNASGGVISVIDQQQVKSNLGGVIL